MLQAQVSEVTANFTVAANRVIAETMATQAKYATIKNIELHVFSLSTALVGMIAAKLPMTTLRMIVPGDELAACVWRSAATKLIKNGLTKQGVTEAMLADAWSPMNLMRAIPAIARIPNIYITLAKGDKFIPYSRGKTFADALAKNSTNVHVQVWPTGHVLALSRYLTTM